MNSQQFVVRDYDIQSDHPLEKLQESVEEAVELYSEKTSMMQSDYMQQTTLHLFCKLSKVLLNPYLIILFVYLSFVFVQLFLLTRSALQGRFRNISFKSSRAKVLLLSAFVSLVATWYKMIAYLFWSYDAFLNRIQVTGDGIATLPFCSSSTSSADCSLTKAIAISRRMQYWLESTSLFEESWLYVVGEEHNWWWSVEVCLFTVGVWACYLCVQGERKQIPHVWAYMILGQTCAISVAQNLFSLALAMHNFSDSEKNTKPPLDADLISPQPTKVSKESQLSDEWIKNTPNTLIRSLIVILACSGLLIVYFVPSDLRSILAMHVFPFILLLPFLRSSSTTVAEIDRYLSLSTVYAALAVLCAGIRISTHVAVFGQDFGNDFQRIVRAALAHPAQSSISADALCIGMTTFLDIQHQRSARLLSNMQSWILSLMIPLIGSSSVFAISLSIREAEVEKLLQRRSVSVSKSRKSSATRSRKNLTQKVNRNTQSDEGSAITPSKSSKLLKTPSKTSTIKKRRRQSRLGLQLSDDE